MREIKLNIVKTFGKDCLSTGRKYFTHYLFLCVWIRINNLFNCVSGLEENFRGGQGCQPFRSAKRARMAREEAKEGE